METIKNFIKKWGGFIALSLVAITSLIVFIISEAKCENELLRIITGFVTLPIAGVGIIAAIFTAIDAKRNEKG